MPLDPVKHVNEAPFVYPAILRQDPQRGLEEMGRELEIRLKEYGNAINQINAGDITGHGALTGLDEDTAHPQYRLISVPIDHGDLVGLGDDDHPQYRLESEDHSHQGAGLQGGQLDHGAALTGLTDDDHTQYLLANGSRNLTGNFLAKPSVDSATFIRVQDAAGDPVLTIDTLTRLVQTGASLQVDGQRIITGVDGVNFFWFRNNAGSEPNNIVWGYTTDGAGVVKTVNFRADSNYVMRFMAPGVIVSRTFGVTPGGSSTPGSNVLSLVNGTPPAGAVAEQISLYSKDSSDGAANATLGLLLEQAVETIGTFTPSHKLKVWINGVEYWIQLDAV